MKDSTSTPAQEQNGGYPVLDTRALVKRHMEDPNHIITDEELRQLTISTDHIDVSQHPLIKALDE